MKSALRCAMLATVVAAPGLAQEVGPPAPPAGQATPRDLAGFVPQDAVVFVDLTGGPALLSRVRALVQDIRELPPQVRLAIGLAPSFLRGATGFDLDELVELLARHEIALALCRPGPGAEPEPLLLARVGADGALRDVDRLLERIRRSRPDSHPIGAAVRDGVLVVVRTPELLARYDRWRAARAPRLADRPDYYAHRAPLARGSGVRVFVDLRALRGAGGGEQQSLFERGDGGQKFLFGPIARVLDRAERFDGALEIGAGRLSFRGAFDAAAVDDTEVAGHLLLAGRGSYPVPPMPAGALARLSLDRSLRGFWQNLDAVLDQGEAAQAQSFLSIADLLLNASFVDDLLPALGEPITLFALAGERAAAGDGSLPTIDLPKIELPSFALCAPLRDPRGADLLTRLYRTLLSVSQQERRQRGEVVFQLRKRQSPQGDVLWVAEPEDWRGPGAPPLACGFSPTLAFAHEHAVLASTRSGAESCLLALAQGEPATACGDELRVRLASAGEYLLDNRDVLALGDVLDKGKTIAEARSGIDVLAGLLRAFDAASVSFRPSGEHRTVLDIDLELAR